MTEIIPFPQNRYFTVLRALPFTAAFFGGGGERLAWWMMDQMDSYAWEQCCLQFLFIIRTAESVCRHRDVFLETHALLVCILDFPQVNLRRSGSNGAVCRIIPILAKRAFFCPFHIYDQRRHLQSHILTFIVFFSRIGNTLHCVRRFGGVPISARKSPFLQHFLSLSSCLFCR